MSKTLKKTNHFVMKRKTEREDEKREQRILDQLASQPRVPIPAPGGPHKVKAKDRKRTRRIDKKSLRDYMSDYNKGK